MKNSSQHELLTPQVIKITPAEIKKNQKLNDKQSSDDIMIAVDYLAKVMKGLTDTLGRKPYRNEILDEMRRIGFDISKATLWRYKGKIHKVRTAVRDLLEEGTYSAYFEHNMELLDDIEEYAIQCYLKSWTNSKMVKKEVPTQDGIVTVTENTVTGEVSSGKSSFLNILAKVVELRRSALNDENINLASAMLSEDFQTLKEKFEESERKLVEANKELKSVLRKKRGHDTSTD